jgi:molybdopterin/thiamine biosynthesis adenylyltransferase/rhodanese-related sulfurtransferase/molybdopterin converting factor small subunit
MATIFIPTPLRPYTDGASSVDVPGETVGAVLNALTTTYAGLARHLRDDSGKLRSFVNVYLGDEDIRFLDGDLTPVKDGDELTIVPSIAGGSDEEELPELTHEEIARYSRHLILDEIGMLGQRKLKNAAVLCVGTGGLGSPLLLYLASAGVGRIGIVDFDVVDHSNLHRQIIHGTSSVGMSKVRSAAARLADINPNVQLDLFEEPLTSENALELLAPYDVVVDGTDNFPTRYLVNDACVILGKPNVYGSIFKFEGQASVFNYQGGPNYRDLYPEPPPPGLVPSCAEGGVLGILPGIIGVIQATETVKIILGQGSTLSGRLLLYDALNMKFREMKLRVDPQAKPITELVDYQQFCGIPSASDTTALVEDEPFTNVAPSVLAERREGGWNPFVIDVRKPHEADIANLAFVDLLQPHDQIAAVVDQIPRDRDVVVYCKKGGRSAKAARILAEQGFTQLFNLDGGINAWSTDVDQSVPLY